MDFTLSPEIESLRVRVRAFVEEHVLPLESDRANFSEHENIPDERLAPVREKAKKAGLWAPQSPKEYGGMDLPMVGWAVMYEEAARSLFGPLAFNCMAPDDGNMNLLKKVATPEQKKKWLKPIVEGKVRSSVVMTEPAPGGGSDPSMIKTYAEKHGDKWKIYGRKWFITGAAAASHFILAARTSDDKRKGITTFLYHKDQPGWRIVRRIPILGPEEHGGHCELEFDGLEVHDDDILGGLGNGLRMVQVRLGPARLTHCMRWLGWSKRCMEIAQEYVNRREGFGIRLADRESVQMKLGEVGHNIQIGPGCSPCMRPGSSIRVITRGKKCRWPRCTSPTRCTRLLMWRSSFRVRAAIPRTPSWSGCTAPLAPPAWSMALMRCTRWCWPSSCATRAAISGAGARGTGCDLSRLPPPARI